MEMAVRRLVLLRLATLAPVLVSVLVSKTAETDPSMGVKPEMTVIQQVGMGDHLPVLLRQATYALELQVHALVDVETVLLMDQKHEMMATPLVEMADLHLVWSSQGTFEVE